jgi:hypothetical protein
LIKGGREGGGRIEEYYIVRKRIGRGKGEGGEYI